MPSLLQPEYWQVVDCTRSVWADKKTALSKFWNNMRIENPLKNATQNLALVALILSLYMLASAVAILYYFIQFVVVRHTHFFFIAAIIFSQFVGFLSDFNCIKNSELDTS
jgi:hypothetical protein